MNFGVWRWFAAVCLLSGCVGLAKAPEVSSAVVVPAHVRQEHLPSGLSLVVETAPDTELGGVALVVDAGAVRESAGKEGLAHWVEHLAFRGRHHEGPSIERRLNAMAASWNGQTSHDYVLYYAFAAKSELPKLLELAADMMAEPLAGIADDVYEHERRVVEAERGFRSDHTPGQVRDFIYQSVFPANHPYGRPVGGTASNIGKWTPDDARAFVADNYRPSRMTLYVFSPREAETLALVKKTLGADAVGPGHMLPAVPPLPRLSLEPPGELVRRGAALPAPELWLSWPLAADTRQERAAAEMLEQVASIGASPSFESNRAIASGGCSLDRSKLKWLLNCRILLNDTRDLDSTISQLLSELRGTVANSPYRQDWFWRIKRRFLIERALEAEPPAARGMSFALNDHEYADPLEAQHLLDAVGQLTFSDISKQVFELMRREHTYMTLVEPLPGVTTAPAVPTGFATELATDDGQADVDTSVVPALAALPRRNFAQASRFTLSNGLTLLVQPVSSPFLSAVMAFRGGNVWAAEPATARAAAEAEIWSYVEPDPITWGIDLRRDRNDDQHWYAARSVGLGFEKSLQILSATKNAQVKWPSPDFRRLKPTLERYDAAPENRAERELRRLLYGEHPYSAYAEPAALEGVSVQAVRRLFTALHRPERGALVVVGNVDPAEIRQECETELRDWQVAPTSAVTLPLASLRSPTTMVDVEHRAASTQADLHLSCLVPFHGGADRAAAAVLAQVLRTAVWKQLRGATGAAYFAGASVEPTSAGAMRVQVRTSVDNRHLDAAFNTFGRLLRREGTKVPTAMFERARYDVIRGFAFDDTTTDEIAFSLLESWQYGESLTELDARPKLIGAVTVEQTQSLLDACLARAALSIVGDQPTIDAALANAALPRRRSLE